MADEPDVNSLEFREAMAKRIIEKLGNLPHIGYTDEQGRFILPQEEYDKD